MKRRNFLAAGLSAAVAGSLAAMPRSSAAADAPAAGAAKFKMKYAPTLNAFSNHAGPDPLDNLQFIADQGFSAFFDNGLARNPRGEAIIKKAESLGLTPGPFVASAGKLVLDEDGVREQAVTSLQKAVEDAKRLNVAWILIVPGPLIPGLTLEQMQANVIKNLKHAADKVDFAGKVIVLEPLNPRNHKGLFLTKIAQAMAICQAVGSPSIRIVNDLYHQQITEGDLIPNIDAAWDYIAAFHLGDTPGRKEPLTGEINYRNIFKHIHEKGYQGVLCMEHGKSLPGIEGEKKLLAAYRWCDDFDKPIA